MAANKRLADLTDYVSVLPYASELFGVYQPLIGWKSKRRLRKIHAGIKSEFQAKLADLRNLFHGQAEVPFNADQQMGVGIVKIGGPRGPILRPANGSLLLSQVAQLLANAGEVPQGSDWHHFINEGYLSDCLNGKVYEAYQEDYSNRERAGRGQPGFDVRKLQAETVRHLRDESAAAGMLLTLVQREYYSELQSVFYAAQLDQAAFE